MSWEDLKKFKRSLFELAKAIGNYIQTSTFSPSWVQSISWGKLKYSQRKRKERWNSSEHSFNSRHALSFSECQLLGSSTVILAVLDSEGCPLEKIIDLPATTINKKFCYSSLLLSFIHAFIFLSLPQFFRCLFFWLKVRRPFTSTPSLPSPEYRKSNAIPDSFKFAKHTVQYLETSQNSIRFYRMVLRFSNIRLKL